MTRFGGALSGEIRTWTNIVLVVFHVEIPLKFPGSEKKLASRRRPRTFSQSGGHAFGGIVVRPCVRQKWIFFTFQKLYSFLDPSSHSPAPLHRGFCRTQTRIFDETKANPLSPHTLLAAAGPCVQIFIYLL